ncbi:MCE family protein [Aldersonia kunmingensis]|uniref:MCE family protein n=1 Tax=Aldersonia kunmingensis TaxID=408066 RepID=UPI0008366376|nr:MCE family protein [Aldersonia kunmingensis]
MSEQSTSTSERNRRWLPITLIVIAAVIVASVGWMLYNRFTTTKITAYFDRSVGIYEGSEVRILGVPVGSVDKVEPQGDQVKVVMSVDRGYDIPVDAKAMQITPSVVADRYIQIAPPYTGGEKMGRDATITRENTATPVEVDELYASIAKLSNDLGPNGANANGAVSDLLTVSSANLENNGQALGASITQLSRASRYLSDARGDIFDTIKNLQVFVSMLAENDSQVREFNAQLADISTFLAGERQNLGEALNLLSISLGDVARFVNDNRAQIQGNAEALTALTQTLANQADNVAAALPVLPVALSNLVNVHDAESGTLDMRANIPEIAEPFSLFCKLLEVGKLKPGDPVFEELGRTYRPVVDACFAVTEQLAAGVKSPTLNLPFGILSKENQQANPVPGTVPGNPSPRQTDGVAPSEQEEGGQ